MSISFFLLMLGIMFIITGYTHQVTPSCDKGVRLKLVNREEFNNSYPKLVTDIMTSYVEELFSCSRYVTKKKDIAQSLANRGFQTLEDLNVTDVTKLFNIEASPDDCIVSSIRRTISRDIIRKQNEGKLSLIHLKWNSNFNDSGDFLFKIDGRQIPADKILT